MIQWIPYRAEIAKDVRHAGVCLFAIYRGIGSYTYVTGMLQIAVTGPCVVHASGSITMISKGSFVTPINKPVTAKRLDDAVDIKTYSKLPPPRKP